MCSLCENIKDFLQDTCTSGLAVLMLNTCIILTILSQHYCQQYRN